MKTMISYKIICLLSVIALAIPSFGQNNDTHTAPPLTIAAKMKNAGITATQTGTITVENGKATVSLSKETIAQLNNPNFISSYYVVFTPIGRPVVAGLSEKGKDSFTLQLGGKKGFATGIQVDYVVYVHAEPNMTPVSAVK